MVSGVALFLAFRTIAHGCLLALTRRCEGESSLNSRLVAGFALGSLAVFALARYGPAELAYPASLVDFALQLAVLLPAGFAVDSRPSRRRWVAFLVPSFAIAFCVSTMVPLYGSGP